MDCPNCGTYLWDTTKPCPTCNPPASDAPPTAVDDPAPVQVAAAPQGPAPWLPVKPYAPSGLVDGKAYPMLLVAMLAAGVGVGLGYHYLTKFINLFLIMPVLGGLLTGAFVGGAARRGHCRRPLLAVSFAFIAGIIAYGGDMVLGALDDRPMLVQVLAADIIQDNPDVPQTQAEATVDHLLTPWQTLKIDTEMRADAGVSVSHSGTSSAGGGIPLRGNVYYGLIVVELLLFAGCSAAVAGSMAAARYCETCHLWHRGDIVFKADSTLANSLLNAIQAHDWPRAAEIARGNKSNTKSWLSIRVDRCPNCNDALIVGTSNDGKNTRKVFEQFLPVEDVQQLVALGKLKAVPARA